MTSEVTYLGDLRAESVHLSSGAKFVTDAPVDNHGRGEAFSPTDLVATALANCMLTVMGIGAQGRGIDMDGTHVSINKIMAANPRRISRIEATVTFPNKPFTDEQKKLLEHIALTCPVAQSLHPDLEQAITFVWPS